MSSQSQHAQQTAVTVPSGPAGAHYCMQGTKDAGRTSQLPDSLCDTPAWPHLHCMLPVPLALPLAPTAHRVPAPLDPAPVIAASRAARAARAACTACTARLPGMRSAIGTARKRMSLRHARRRFGIRRPSAPRPSLRYAFWPPRVLTPAPSGLADSLLLGGGAGGRAAGSPAADLQRHRSPAQSMGRARGQKLARGPRGRVGSQSRPAASGERRQRSGHAARVPVAARLYRPPPAHKRLHSVELVLISWAFARHRAPSAIPCAPRPAHMRMRRKRTPRRAGWALLLASRSQVACRGGGGQEVMLGPAAVAHRPQADRRTSDAAGPAAVQTVARSPHLARPTRPSDDGRRRTRDIPSIHQDRSSIVEPAA